MASRSCSRWASARASSSAWASAAARAKAAARATWSARSRWDRQLERFGFGLGQHLGRLARALGLALAFAREDGDTGVGTGAVQHFFTGGMHCSDTLCSLQARLLRFGHQFIGRMRGLGGQPGIGLGQFSGALARFLLQAAPGFGSEAHVRVGLDAGAQVGGFLAYGFQALGAGHGSGTQCFQAIAIGLDGVFRCLRTGQRGGCRLRIHGRAFLGHRAGTRFGMRPVFRGKRRLGFRLDPCNRFLDGVHIHRPALGRQIDVQVGVIVWGKDRVPSFSLGKK